MTTRLLLLAALLLLPHRAIAADVPVTYTVEEKPLKAVVAGTPLTFELYTDSACSGPIAHSQVVNVEDTERIVRLKPFNPKNATKKPNTAELRKTLAGVNEDGVLFLKVTGEGIAPVGGACQAQGSLGMVSLPAISVTLRYGYTFPASWGVEAPSPAGLADPTSLFASNARSTAAINALSPTKRYSCSVQTGGKASEIPTNFGYYVPVVDLGACDEVTCTDVTQNGGETDVDCGGSTPCPRCVSGKSCSANSDCTSHVCTGNVCQP
jgi:hypothetical protein